MYNDHLRKLVEERISEGRQELSFRNREVVYNLAPGLFDLLDYEDDDTFLEPLLFNYNNLPPEYQNLEQILYGYIPDDKKRDIVQVLTDSAGRAYLPKIGHIRTNAPNQKIKLIYNIDTSSLSKAKGSNYELTNFTGIKRAHSFELYQDDILSLRGYFRLDSQEDELNVADMYSKHSDKIEKALDIIRSVYPEFYGSFSDVIKGFYMFYCKNNRSFASMQSLGISFLNVEHENGLVFFLEDVLHQSSHNMFYYTLLDEDMFAVNPNEDLVNYSDHRAAHGDIYGTFHGLFTLTNINTCLVQCLKNNVFEGENELETKGRISDNMKRFKTAIDLFDIRKIFTEEGWKLYNSLRESYESLYLENKDLINSFDTSNQPYVFSFSKFKEANPVVTQ
ncbi:MAG: hypothetical protein WBA74_12205 [Cyclobacteriaceae bacterium]